MLVLSGVKLNKMKSLGIALNRSYLSYSRFIEERLRALKYIKVLNIEKESYHVIQKLLDQVYQLSRVRVLAKNNLDLLTQPLFYILLLGFIWVSDTYFNLTIASIMVFLLLGTRLMPLLQSFNSEYSLFLIQIASAESVFQLIDQKIALNLQSKKRYDDEIDQLSVVDMSFHYTKNHTLFNCINYTFHKGKKYAILGQSGAGKTTLIDIILGLIVPSNGSIIINQSNDILKNYSLDAFYLPQIPIVIEGTIKENLSFTTSKEFSEAKMWQALDYVALKETFEERHGLDTHIEFDAILARVYSLENKSYWQRAHDSLTHFTSYSKKPIETNMIGRPAIYRKKAIQYCGFDSFFNGVGNEDADISRRMEIAGFRQGIGTGVAYRNHSDAFFEVFLKFRKYGRGDAHFIYKYPDKRFEMVFHTLIRYPIIRGGKVILRSKPQYFPYFLICGWVRFFYLFITYIKLLVKQPRVGGIQDNYYKTV